MANKKKLLLQVLNVETDNHPHEGAVEDSHVTKELSENHFRVETTRKGKDGHPDDKIVGHYLVMTDEEALEAGYNPKKGAMGTKDDTYKVYRTA